MMARRDAVAPAAIVNGSGSGLRTVVVVSRDAVQEIGADASKGDGGVGRNNGFMIAHREAYRSVWARR